LSRDMILGELPKTPTGISGLDEITQGGLPTGRPTLVCGGAGCGKTLMGLSFLANGVMTYDEPGVFISFEERVSDLVANVKSLGVDLNALIEDRKIAVDHVWVDRAAVEETGEYDLEGLFVRLEYAISTVNAKRLVIDTIETLFSYFPNEAIMRSELVRLFGWLKDRNMTTIITGERGDGTISRHGLEEYVSDCVILLDHRVQEQVSTRRFRIVKYRGSSHGTNEYPFLIDDAGLTIMPITSVGLDHEVSNERVSTGIERLDAMLGGEGYYRGSSILISGTAGTGKTTMAAHFVEAACRHGDGCIYFAFEESPAQITRNMQSVGIDLGTWRAKGLLHIEACRPMIYGLEMHLVHMYRLIERLAPKVVVIDPISNLIKGGTLDQAHAMMLRLIDYLKSTGITALCTNLTHGTDGLEETRLGMSSVMDTWLLLRDIEEAGERNRGMYVLKARGMAHSNQIREYQITDSGVRILDVAVGIDGVLTGSARLAQEARERAQEVARRQEIERRRRQLSRKRALFQAQLAQLQAGFETEEEEILQQIQEATAREQQVDRDREAMRGNRKSEQSIAPRRNEAVRTDGRAHEKTAQRTKSKG
jgi:circadian clock protein KaiC